MTLIAERLQRPCRLTKTVALVHSRLEGEGQDELRPG